MIAIYRQAKAGQRSSNNHLYNEQELNNQDPIQNPNSTLENILITVNDEGKFVQESFFRNGKNEKLMERINKKQDMLTLEAKSDYRDFKLEEREKNPGKKIRTELQSKNLNKEFIIAFGDTSRTELLTTFKKQELLDKILFGTGEILIAKGLGRKNLVAIVIHQDEPGNIHAHIQYNDYSFKEHTTANQLEKSIDANKTSKEQIYAKKQMFASYQTILADAMGMERGEFNSKRKHLSVLEYKNKKEKEKLIQQELEFTTQKTFNDQKLDAYHKDIKKAREELDRIDDNIVLKTKTVAGKAIIRDIDKAFGMSKTADIEEFTEILEQLPKKNDFIKTILSAFKPHLEQLTVERAEIKQKRELDRFISKQRDLSPSI